MLEFIAGFSNKDLPQPLRLYMPTPFFTLPPSFPTAELYRVVSGGYTGAALDHLVARSDDFVIAYGSIPGTDYAIGYNLRSKWGGNLPMSVLEKVQQ